MKKIELEERLIDFSCDILEITSSLKQNYAADHLGKQLIRSGTSATLNFAESRDAESRRDFIHKIKVALKELRETLVCLRLIRKARLETNEDRLTAAINECNQLVAIFVSSVKTASRKS